MNIKSNGGIRNGAGVSVETMVRARAFPHKGARASQHPGHLNERKF